VRIDPISCEVARDPLIRPDTLSVACLQTFIGLDQWQ
jgi:hypothetical protein